MSVNIDTATELTYYQNDGILHYVIRKMLTEPARHARALPGTLRSLPQQMPHFGGFGIEVVRVF